MKTVFSKVRPSYSVTVYYTKKKCQEDSYYTVMYTTPADGIPVFQTFYYKDGANQLLAELYNKYVREPNTPESLRKRMKQMAFQVSLAKLSGGAA